MLCIHDDKHPPHSQPTHPLPPGSRIDLIPNLRKGCGRGKTRRDVLRGAVFSTIQFHYILPLCPPPTFAVSCLPFLFSSSSSSFLLHPLGLPSSTLQCSRFLQDAVALPYLLFFFAARHLLSFIVQLAWLLTLIISSLPSKYNFLNIFQA